jgi:hypothetical protein
MKILRYGFFILAGLVQAQVSTNLQKNLNSEDSTALATIASFPDSTRKHILEASKRTDILIKTEALQKNSSMAFRDLVNDYSKEEQEKFWDLARYPGLLSKIGGKEKKSKQELETIASAYPSEIRPTINEFGKKHAAILAEIDILSKQTDDSFEKLLAGNPETTKKAYRSLISKPDALNTLASNMHLSVTLGEMYKSNPKQTSALLDSLHSAQLVQKAKDFEEWKNGLEKNPTAKYEMEKAAKEFVNDNAARADEADAPVDDVYHTGGNPEPTPRNNPPVVNYVIQPYPYWIGYPTWFDYPYWYPYPYWYHTGFYWGPAGISFVGLPSPFFMHWYFYHPYHHYHYAHFTDYSLGFRESRYGPRTQSTGFNEVVNRWAQTNAANLPRGYLKQDAQRPQRIKELGRFEMDYHNNTKGLFGRNISRTDFLKNNSEYYPRLKPVIQQPSFNQPIKYPEQQTQPRFDMTPKVKPQPQQAPIQRQNVPTRKGGNQPIKKSPR